MYASSPVKAVLGQFVVCQVVHGEPPQIWREYGLDVGISKQEYDKYYEGAEVAYAIVLSDPCTFERPVDLDELRKEWNGFHPPQTYRYLDADSVNALLGMASAV